MGMLNNSMKINSTKITHKKCINGTCNNQILIKLFDNPDHLEYDQPIAAHKRKIACSRECHKNWQLSISWEDRIGSDKAATIRKVRSESASLNNPSKQLGVAKKISNGLKKYFLENPDIRKGSNNNFFGKNHSDKTKETWRNNKRGKWSYNSEQKEKQLKNTPKKDKHPNWMGGVSNGEYGIEFNKELKKQIKNSYSYICQLCNAANLDLDIHHIDYNKTNNSLSNLIPLCKSCHSKTNYNRKEWQTRLTEIKNTTIINNK